MGKTVALILAGGRGKRMDVLCHVRPKPALPFAGCYRVIDLTLSNCIYSRISDIAVLTDYQRSHMAQYIKRWNLANPSNRNMHILEPKAGAYKGTADAVFQNLDYLRGRNADVILVLAGDHVYKMDYAKMLAFHREVNADVTVGVIPVPNEQAHCFGTVTLNSEDRITGFLEKSSMPQSNLASMGIYVFNKDVLAKRLIEDASGPSSRHDFGYSILPRMVKQDKVFAYRFDGYWQDIGTIEAYYTANMNLIDEKPPFSLDGVQPVLTQNNGSSTKEEFESANVVNSIISAGCTIKGRVENSILSPGVWVDKQAVIRNSVLMSNVFVGYHSIVDRCIIDEGVEIGRMCDIGFGRSLLPGDWDVSLLGKGVTVPAHTAIGRNCRVLPHVVTLSFRGNMIPSGTTTPHQGTSQQLSPKEEKDRGPWA